MLIINSRKEVGRAVDSNQRTLGLKSCALSAAPLGLGDRKFCTVLREIKFLRAVVIIISLKYAVEYYGLLCDC